MAKLVKVLNLKGTSRELSVRWINLDESVVVDAYGHGGDPHMFDVKEALKVSLAIQRIRKWAKSAAGKARIEKCIDSLRKVRAELLGSAQLAARTELLLDKDSASKGEAT